jgi:hypothetical protein
LRSVEGERVVVEGGVKGIGGDRGKFRDEGSVWWGSLFAFVLFCLVFLVLEEEDTQEGSDEEENSERRGEAARQDGGGILLVEAVPCRSWSRRPNAVKREREGNLRMRVAVSLGIPWIYPWDKARRKVEPKQRCK